VNANFPRRALLSGAVASAATVITPRFAAAESPPDGSVAPARTAAAATSLRFPDTTLCRRTQRLIARTQQPFLRNHSLRSFLFARAASAAGGVRHGEDYDAELVFLICALHDMGLTATVSSDLRFEVAGADFAAEFLQSQGADDATIDTVWLAIALHTTQHIHASRVFRRRASAEISIAQTGIGIDLDGPDGLPTGYAAKVTAAYPRAGGGRALFAAIEKQGLASPLKAPPTSFAGELIHQRHPSLPYLTLDLLLEANGWGD
jgi:hypothetical protein